MSSKNNRHIKLWIVLLLIIPTFYAFGSKTDINAFKFEISDNAPSSLSFNSIIDNDIGGTLLGDQLSAIPDYSQPGVGVTEEDEDEDKDEVNEEGTGETGDLSSNSKNDESDGFSKYTQQNFLPLIKDYADFPSSFLTSPESSDDKVIPNQYIVVLKSHNTDKSDFFSDIASKINLKDMDLLQQYENVLNGFAIHVPNEKIIDIIKKSPLVAYVEKDVMVQSFAQSIPTGINRIDADQSSAKSGDGSGTTNADIAIIDSGIDLDHSDLNVYHQKSFVSNSLFGSGSSTADDDNGHGTHVAGIAAAKDNSIGTVGVAPGAKLWAIKVLDSNGSGPLSTVIKGIDYVTQYANQIEVANLSLGCECKSTAFDSAINNAVKAGIVFVVAAGNGAKDARTFSPANNPNAIAVSAIGDSDGKCGGKGPATGYGSDDALASFSNYGSDVDIAAPGTKIYSTYKGNSYATMSGTSMASPHVAGAAALYMADNPGASPSEVRNALLSHGSLPGIVCDGMGHGYFTGDKDQSREPLLYVKDPGQTSNTISPPTADAGSDRTVDSGVTVQLDGSGSSDPNNSPLTYSWTQTSGPAVALSSSSSSKPTFTAPQTSAKTDLVFKLEVTNNNGVKSEPDSVRITVNPIPISKPTADAGSDRTVDSGVTVQLDGSGSSDPNNSPLTYSWTQTSGPAVALSSSSSSKPTFTAPQTSAKTDLVFKLEVTNNNGVKSEPDSVRITVNPIPISKPTADAGSDRTVDSGVTVQLDGSGSSDPNNSPLTYSWTQTSGPAVALSSSSSSKPTFTAPQTTSNNIVLKFQLVVTNNLGVSSDPDSTTITIKPVSNNDPNNNNNGMCGFLSSRPEWRSFFGC
ncbi:MAG: S8 family serine peptidase [Candidatus Nitrosocosmicus sp.]|nr:S8 family serine peptidase [Candidatus Nitrosocosmicus sp.]